MELGGNIELINFDNLETQKLIVVKKMVGNYAKNMKEASEFNKLIVTLNEDEVKANLTANGKEYNATAIDSNLFFALDKSLSKIIKDLKE